MKAQPQHWYDWTPPVWAWFLLGAIIGGLVYVDASTRRVRQEPPPLGFVQEIAGPNDPALPRLVATLVDRRLEERLNPTQEEIDGAVEAAISGNKQAAGGPSAWFAGAIAAVVVKAIKVALAALILSAVLGLLLTYWYWPTIAVVVSAAWVEWRARAAAKRGP
jgi:hypothetical protein